MQTTELHTYLALAGNQRLLHLEEEIFADKAATTIYLHNLCRDLEWCGKADTNAALACFYAFFEIKDRYIYAERLIMMSAQYASVYAREILNKRWPEAEPYIRKCRPAWATYTEHFNIE